MHFRRMPRICHASALHVMEIHTIDSMNLHNTRIVPPPTPIISPPTPSRR